jgi:hypothetical protein
MSSEPGSALYYCVVCHVLERVSRYTTTVFHRHDVGHVPLRPLSGAEAACVLVHQEPRVSSGPVASDMRDWDAALRDLLAEEDEDG